MKKFISIWIFVLFCTAAYSQSINVEAIKADTTLLYGEATAITVEEADEYALQNLISKISLTVSSSTHDEAQESTVGGTHTSNTRFSSVIETYSHASLANTRQYVISMDPEPHVIRWIRKADIQKLFELRKFNINDRVITAESAEKNGKLEIALMNYYWAFLLLQTLQYPGEMTFTPDGDTTAHPLLTYIPNKINDILGEIDAKVVKRDGTDLELFFTYKGKPVTNLVFTYFDGRNYSAPCDVKDGIGTIELVAGHEAKYIQLKYEYMFYQYKHQDKDIQSIFESRSIRRETFRKASVSIPSGIQKPAKIEHVGSTISTEGTDRSIRMAAKQELGSINAKERFSAPKVMENDAKYRSVINDLLAAIEKKQYNTADSLFTPEGAEIFKQLLKYGKARIVGEPNYMFYKNGDEVIARGGYMTFSFANGMKKSFVEDVVFTFNKEQKINNITFGLGSEATKDILYKGSWSEKARIAMMEFLENYKTAYALKRLDYIETIFDDDAVIITGKKVKVAPKVKGNEEITISVRGNEIIQYNRMTKDEFLRHLKTCFTGKEFINIRFSENRVRKMGVGGEMYAIEIAQDYYSSNYGDKGYLFLMVDINNPKQPTIKVRTWQPEKDPKFGLYGPGDFQ